MINEEQFRRYVAAFNADDFEGFGQFYAEDVVFELGNRKRIEGRENILAFYREVKARIREVVTPIGILVGEKHIAMYCHTLFETIEDWEDFELWPTRKGDRREVETIAWYDVADGHFTHVRGARFKP